MSMGSGPFNYVRPKVEMALLALHFWRSSTMARSNKSLQRK